LGGGEPAFGAYNTLAYTVVHQLLIIVPRVFLAVIQHFGQQNDIGGLNSNLTISNIVVLQELGIITSLSSLQTAVSSSIQSVRWDHHILVSGPVEEYD
jgi:hypothetical protein